MQPTQNTKEYWAAAPIDQIAAKIKEKYLDYRTWLSKVGYLDRIQSSYNAFYNIDRQGSLRVTRDDDIAQLNVPHFKSLIKRLQLIVTENKLKFDPISLNTDTKSLVKADLAKGICQYYGESKNMNSTLSQGRCSVP